MTKSTTRRPPSCVFVRSAIQQRCAAKELRTRNELRQNPVAAHWRTTSAPSGRPFTQQISVKQNHAPTPDPGKVHIWCPKTPLTQTGTVPLNAQPNSDYPDPPVADGTAYPLGDFAPLDNCEADHAPTPDPGKIDVLAPKNGSRS